MQAVLPRNVSSLVLRHPALPARRGNSFIKQVMEQVKRDIEADSKMKKDWDKAQNTAAKMRDVSSQQGEKMASFGESVKSMSAKTSEMLNAWKTTAEEKKKEAAETYAKTAEESEAAKKAAEFAKTAAESGTAGSRMVFTKTKNVFDGVMDSTSKAFAAFGDDASKVNKWKDWKAGRDVAAAHAEAAKEKVDAAKAAAEAAEAEAEADPLKAEATDKAEAQPEPVVDAPSELVVSADKTSSWDRMGARLGDMPFLSNVFENPLFDRLFGESEIAASIREMKEIDYQFRLEDFAEDVEYIVAPHIIKTYLDGDSESLERHCGEAAFNAVNASIKARKTQKLTLDTNILAGPHDVELKGAMRFESGPPCFVWTFHMQQVNCLRDKDGEIIEGAVDDIRTVFYAMALQKQMELDVEVAVDYPWQVSELAILGNQACF